MVVFLGAQRWVQPGVLILPNNIGPACSTSIAWRIRRRTLKIRDARYEFHGIMAAIPHDHWMATHASAPHWLDPRHVHRCFVCMCVCATRTNASFPRTSAGGCTAGDASPLRSRMALGPWALRPLRPLGRRPLHTQLAAKDIASAQGSGRHTRPSTEPIARVIVDEPSARNALGQRATGIAMRLRWFNDRLFRWVW